LLVLHTVLLVLLVLLLLLLLLLLLYYCTTVLLYYCTTVLLYYCTTTTTAAGGRVERGVPSSHLHHTVCYWSEFASSRSDNTAMRARIE
jgi:hypothetical protein